MFRDAQLGSPVMRALAFALLVAAGCTALVEADTDSLGTQPRACAPGEVNPQCACEGGGFGTQVCNQGGSFDPCMCNVPVAGQGGSATPTGSR